MFEVRVLHHSYSGPNQDHVIELAPVGNAGTGCLSLGPLPASHPLVAVAVEGAVLTFTLAAPAEAPVVEEHEPAEPQKGRRKAAKEHDGA